MVDNQFLIVESFDEETAIEVLSNDDPVLWVAEDAFKMESFTEDQGVAILENYAQIRKYLIQKQRGRGCTRPKSC